MCTHPGADYIGLEPNPYAVSYLTELAEVNAVRNCLILPIGLADEVRLLPLYRSRGSNVDSAATTIADLRPWGSFNAAYVSLFPLDLIYQWLPERLGNVGFIKIDVEGAELDVIRGMRSVIRRCRPLILCEVLFTDPAASMEITALRNSALMDCLHDLGYAVFQLIKSEDARRVVRADCIQSFPLDLYSELNKELCDYLFIPEDYRREVMAALFPASSGSKDACL